ncbi:MAG: hypothetical protein A2901_03370 [Elusimicrobia bacterium RIFCSPLOWO2_01_FULL_54_10]|nr:MAG: hypothetical protein A2901_03370 [Elusimicrobia bacterium RIFCSPLOWO2_01_FULL_54_10]
MEIKSGLALAFLFTLTGCSASFNIRNNLAEGQIIDPVVTRKPTLETALGIFPKYQEYLEGYVVGGVVEAEGRPLQGATVRVVDETGTSGATFEDGVTDQDGMYKVRFSVPIRWNRVDCTGTVGVEPPWQVVAPRQQFVIRYIGKAGVLALYANPMWVPVKSTLPKVQEEPPPVKPKKSLDGFDGMDFGD